jgi:hypothetical protein
MLYHLLLLSQTQNKLKYNFISSSSIEPDDNIYFKSIYFIQLKLLDEKCDKIIITIFIGC